MASNKVIPKYTQVLPIQYANGDVLKAYLDEKFASKPYTMSLRNNNWTITVPFRLSQAEINEVNEQMRVHYYGR